MKKRNPGNVRMFYELYGIGSRKSTDLLIYPTLHFTKNSGHKSMGLLDLPKNPERYGICHRKKQQVKSGKRLS